MSDPGRDQPINIEGDPDEVLKALLETGQPPEFTVLLSEADDGGEHPEGPVAPHDPTPAVRVFDWRGNALDPEGAIAAAKDAWAKHYGEPVRNARAVVKRA